MTFHKNKRFKLDRRNFQEIENSKHRRQSFFPLLESNRTIPIFSILIIPHYSLWRKQNFIPYFHRIRKKLSQKSMERKDFKERNKKKSTQREKKIPPPLSSIRELLPLSNDKNRTIPQIYTRKIAFPVTGSRYVNRQRIVTRFKGLKRKGVERNRGGGGVSEFPISLPNAERRPWESCQLPRKRGNNVPRPLKKICEPTLSNVGLIFGIIFIIYLSFHWKQLNNAKFKNTETLDKFDLLKRWTY